MCVSKSLLFIIALLTTTAVFSQIPTSDYPIQPIDFQQVALRAGFWKARVDTAVKVTIPYAFQKCEETGRVNNFIYAAGIKKGHFEGDQGFDDSDVFKVLEGAAYSLMTHKDPALRAYVDSLVAYIAGAQEDDGYLYTAWTLRANDYMDLRCCSYDERGQFIGSKFSHELYNVGHMYEAAVAHYRATGEKNFLDVATKNADLIHKICVTEDQKFYPGHQEIELGLVKLYRATGQEKYLELAKLFLDRRGQGLRQFGNEEKLPGLDFDAYSQDHKPVIEQEIAVGHSVRAGYMYSAMADIAAITGDQDYLAAIDKIWHDIVSKKMYITGGLGSGHGIEGFDTAYALPNDAYAETCAAIANVYWNHRMFLLHGHAKYIDVLERSLYNGLLAGLAIEGDKFFYPNPLVFDGKSDFNQGANCRSDWFDCSCCPSNLARFVPSVGGYIYAHSDRRAYVNLFVNSSTNFKMGDRQLRLEQITDYPWQGNLQIKVEAEEMLEADIYIRIPGWLNEQPVPSDLYQFADTKVGPFEISIDGKLIQYRTENGYAVITGEWKNQDIDVTFPMEVRTIRSHAAVKENDGKLAIQRGPILYCAEAQDNPSPVLTLIIDKEAMIRPTHHQDLLGGVSILMGKAKAGSQSVDLTLIPYYAWGHRSIGEMAVWLKESSP